MQQYNPRRVDNEPEGSPIGLGGLVQRLLGSQNDDINKGYTSESQFGDLKGDRFDYELEADEAPKGIAGFVRRFTAVYRKQDTTTSEEQPELPPYQGRNW